jgi:hypothetical protein
MIIKRKNIYKEIEEKEEGNARKIDKRLNWNSINCICIYINRREKSHCVIEPVSYGAPRYWIRSRLYFWKLYAIPANSRWSRKRSWRLERQKSNMSTQCLIIVSGPQRLNKLCYRHKSHAKKKERTRREEHKTWRNNIKRMELLYIKALSVIAQTQKYIIHIIFLSRMPTLQYA